MKHFSFPLFHFVLVYAVLSIVACDKQQKQEHAPQYGKESAVQTTRVNYIFAIHPLHNSHHYFEVYQPLVDYINRHTSEFVLQLESSKDYTHFEEKLRQKRFHFALPNPYQSVQSIQLGYSVFGKMGDDDQFCGIIVVRKDSHIQFISDLRGKSISFPSATALAAAMMPKYFLKMNGLNVEKDADCRYVGSQESSMMNVYLGKTIAGCTWPPPWESFKEDHPEVSDAMTVQWQTDPLINNGLVVRYDVPEQHRKVFAKLLFTLHTHAEGQEILKRINLSRFVAISQNEYVSRVNVFLKKYEHEFGSLPGIGGKP